MSSSLNWGILGTGRIAGIFARALARSQTGKLAAVGSRSEAAQGNKLEAAAADRALSKAWLGDARWLRMDRL